MNERLEHLTKAWDAYSQLVAQLDAAGESLVASKFTNDDWPELTPVEQRIMDLIDAEKVGEDTDAAYEESRA